MSKRKLRYAERHIGFGAQRAIADGAKVCVRVSAVIGSPILSMCSKRLKLAATSSHKACGDVFGNTECWRLYYLFFLFLCVRLVGKKMVGYSLGGEGVGGAKIRTVVF